MDVRNEKGASLQMLQRLNRSYDSILRNVHATNELLEKHLQITKMYIGIKKIALVTKLSFIIRNHPPRSSRPRRAHKRQRKCADMSTAPLFVTAENLETAQTSISRRTEGTAIQWRLFNNENDKTTPIQSPQSLDGAQKLLHQRSQTKKEKRKKEHTLWLQVYNA